MGADSATALISSNLPTMSSRVSQPSPAQVLSLYVIYDADGTLTGELFYMAKKALGLAHCAACDITHGPRREKPEFTALKTTTGWTVPLLNIHRDEMDETMQACVGEVLPAVVARTDGGDFILVRPNELEECAGSVDSFVYIVDERAKKMNLQLNRVSNYCQLLPPSSISTSIPTSATPLIETQPSQLNITSSNSFHDSQVPAIIQPQQKQPQQPHHFQSHQQHHEKQIYPKEYEGNVDDAVVPSPPY